MDRRSSLHILVLTLRRATLEADLVLDRYEAGERESTFPSSLARAFRSVEHDARTVALPKLASFAEAAKELAARPLEAWDSRGTPALLRRVITEMRAVAADLEAGRPHRLEPSLRRALKAK